MARGPLCMHGTEPRIEPQNKLNSTEQSSLEPVKSPFLVTQIFWELERGLLAVR